MPSDNRRSPSPLLQPLPELDKPRLTADLLGRITQLAGCLFVAVAAALVAIAGYDLIMSDVQAGRHQDSRAQQFEQAAQPAPNFVDNGTTSPLPEVPSGLPAPDTTVIPAEQPSDGQIALFARAGYGDIAGRLRIPAINVDIYTSFGTGLDVLAGGPGVWEYGTVPGNPGNATIAGHRTTHGAPFRRLDELTDGDLIHFDHPTGETSTFEVRGSAVVDPSDTSVTGASDGVRLTLSTCTPPGSTAYRLIVQAELVDGPFINYAEPADGWEFIGDI